MQHINHPHNTNVMPTFKELHQQIAPEIKLRAWQIRVKNLTGAYDGNRNATEQEIRALSLPATKRTTTVRTRNGSIMAKKDSRLARASVAGYNKPKRTPGHPKKSHIVVAKEGEKVKTIRFGDQGARTAGKPKAGEDSVCWVLS